MSPLSPCETAFGFCLSDLARLTRWYEPGSSPHIILYWVRTTSVHFLTYLDQTFSSSMCPRPRSPAQQTTAEDPSSGGKVAEDQRRARTPIDIVHQSKVTKDNPHRTKLVPIGMPSDVGKTNSQPRSMRRTYNRLPSNDYVPRMCNNCGMCFIPGSEKLFGREWCSGECRHSFVYRRHLERQRHVSKNA